MPSHCRFARRSAAALLIAVSLSACTFFQHERLDGTAIHESAPPFTLTDQDGRPFSLAAQHGHVVALFFGYTHCHDVCPATMARLAQVVRRLTPSERQRVRVAFITVDPARDDRPTLRRYVRLFDPTFYGLSGSPKQLDAVYASYHVPHTISPGSKAGDATILHGSSIYFINPSGELRVLHDWNDAPKALVHDLKELLS